MADFKSPGQLAFEAYSERKSGKTYDGKSIPKWRELPIDVLEAWDAAASAVEKKVIQDFQRFLAEY
jgi:hypothetical protein